MEDALKVVMNLLASGVSGGIGAALTNPVEVLKVRYQVSLGSGSMSSFACEIVQAEGFWRGFCTPGCSANAWFIGISSVGRVGLYPSIRDSIVAARGGDVAAPTGTDMFAGGLVAGAIGYGAATPVFAQKTVQQAEAGLCDAATGLLTTGARAGSAPTTPGGWPSGVARVVRDGGVAGAFKGASPLIVRGALISAGNMLFYDYFKRAVKDTPLPDGPVTHVLASIAGAVGSTVCGTPADVITTRYMAARGEYTSPVNCATTIVRQEGALALYRGALPLFGKLAPLYLLSLPLYEQIRGVMGLGYS